MSHHYNSFGKGRVAAGLAKGVGRNFQGFPDLFGKQIGANRNQSEQIRTFLKTRNANRRKRENRNKSG